MSREKHPLKVGSIRSVQPSRGVAAVCAGAEKCGKELPTKDCYKPLRIQILSCEPDEEWCEKHLPKEAESEAYREGFRSWNGLWNALRELYPKGVPPLWRIEFKIWRGK